MNDTLNKLAHLREEHIRLTVENAKLAARLEAVVKECEKHMKNYDCGACTFVDESPWTIEQCEIKGCPTRLHAMEFLSILRAALGNEEAKRMLSIP